MDVATETPRTSQVWGGRMSEGAGGSLMPHTGMLNLGFVAASDIWGCWCCQQLKEGFD